MPLSFKNIQPYLSTHQHKASRWLSYFGLCIGVILLLCSIQLFININLLLKDKNPKRTGFDFVSVTKVITNENMASDNRFTEPDIKEIQSQPFIEGAAPLIANQFRVKASAGNIIPFSTDLFVESLDNAFIDTVPPVFSWKEGQTDVPIIFSADFLEMYNVFAPGQDLPQLSAETISSVNIILECYGPGGMESYRGHIVALSDRINSVLVPESFMQMANQRFGGVKNVPASRIYVKTKDANNPEHHVRIFQRPGARFHMTFTHMRKMNEEEHRSEQHEDDAECEIGNLHRFRAVSVVTGKVLEDEVAADERTPVEVAHVAGIDAQDVVEAERRAGRAPAGRSR